MSSKIVGPDGKPTQKVQGVEVDGRVYPYRIVDKGILENQGPAGLIGVGILTQMGDQNNLLWVAMLKLAKDIYARDPEGPREFQEFADKLGLCIMDGNRNGLDVAKELRKI